jgi:amidase
MTGQPAISLPLAWSKAGLPIGVQFVGRFGEEHLLLQLAAQIEKAEQEAPAGLRLTSQLDAV